MTRELNIARSMSELSLSIISAPLSATFVSLGLLSLYCESRVAYSSWVSSFSSFKNWLFFSIFPFSLAIHVLCSIEWLKYVSKIYKKVTASFENCSHSERKNISWGSVSRVLKRPNSMQQRAPDKFFKYTIYIIRRYRKQKKWSGGKEAQKVSKSHSYTAQNFE